MNLLPGARLGLYKIVSVIGKGGMGEVYRARDTKLDRDVAVKVLAGSLAGDRERLARFEREAKILAALNHPNIAHIYGVEDGALVMELVEGDELRGPLEWDEAWKIASQIVDALEYAHERGIIHRDLKPANIKVTPEGTVKLLDFGLAKAIEGQPMPDADPSNSPTLTHGATRMGVILGTAAYMAPEQARGKTADRRSDIWSFGAVLFELLSGKRAFPGESVTDTLAMVLKFDPDWDALPARTPAEARKLVECCLKKERSDRLQAIGDARLLLGALRETSRPEAPESKTRTAWGVAAALAIALVAVATWGWLRPRPQAPVSPGFTLTILPPKGTPLPSLGSATGAPLLSPDGAYVLAGRLLRNLNSLQMESLQSMAELSDEPFWSTDSKWVVFPVAPQLRKMRLPDGAPEVIAQLPGFYRGGTWNRDGTILIAAAETGVWSLYVLPPGGGLTRLVVPGLNAGLYYHPEFLSDGSDFLFWFRADGSDEGEILLATLRNGKVINPTRLMRNPTAAHYTPALGGRIFFARNDNLYSQRLNLRARRLEGDAELLQQRVTSAPAVALANFSVSRSGLLAWRPGTRALSQITAFDRKGKPIGTFGPPGDFNYLRLSPDQTHLLAHFNDNGSQLLEPGQPGLSTLGRVEWRVWSPDGSHLLRREGSRIVERSVSEPGEVRTLAETPNINFLEDISPDGKLALYSSNSSGVRSVFSVFLDGRQGNRPNPIVETGEQILNARFSPDGRWIVYDVRVDNEGRGIFVQPFPGPGLRKQISSGIYPVWRKDGKEIIYLDTNSKQISAISVSGLEADLRFGPSTPLFAMPPAVGLVVGRSPLAVTRDGSRILFPQALEQPEDSNVINIKSSWDQAPR